MPSRATSIAVAALLSLAPAGIACDQEDVRDVREGVKDAGEGVEDVVDDEVDTDGKDD